MSEKEDKPKLVKIRKVKKAKTVDGEVKVSADATTAVSITEPATEPAVKQAAANLPEVKVEKREVEPWKKKENWPTTVLLPTKFEPIHSRFFTLNISAIDSFLVESVEIKPIKSSLLGKSSGKMLVTLYEAVAPSAMQQVYEWLNEGLWAKLKGRKVELKCLDRMGTVIQLTHFEGVKLKEVCRGLYSYEDGGVRKITLELTFKKHKLEF